MLDDQYGEEFHPIPLPDYHQQSAAEMRDSARRFYDFVRRRHSVRQFSSRPVSRGVIEQCLLTAGAAPSGANHQPWHFAAIRDPAMKKTIRTLAEAEEREFYAGRAGEEWLRALKPIGTDPGKPFLETAPWLICIFGARKSRGADGKLYKNYYVPESVSIATGFLILALHNAGLATLTHTPAPMGFLNEICDRPKTDKPYILLVTGYPDKNAEIPAHATVKKPLNEIATFF
jgi:iodotyrosine deiodinase